MVLPFCYSVVKTQTQKMVTKFFSIFWRFCHLYFLRISYILCQAAFFAPVDHNIFRCFLKYQLTIIRLSCIIRLNEQDIAISFT